MIFNNKKGSTFMAFIEIMLISILFVVALGIIGTNMNSLYGQNKDMSFGLVTNQTLSDLKSTQATLDTATQEGTSSFSALGIFTLTTLPKMLLTTLNLIKGFLLGTWIRSLIELMNLGDYSGIIITIFQILYFIMLIFILIKLILRINP